MEGKGKIIGLGFHKTGLSSLKLALEILGFKTTKGRQSFKHKFDEDAIVDMLNKQKFNELFPFLNAYDAVVDLPWYLFFEQLDAHFPNSKFILTVRDEDHWIKSIKNYFKHLDNPFLRPWVYGTAQIDGNEDNYLRTYREHNEMVIDYFKHREQDLLILDLEKGGGWKELCPFLDKPVINLPFPVQNKNLITD